MSQPCRLCVLNTIMLNKNFKKIPFEGSCSNPVPASNCSYFYHIDDYNKHQAMAEIAANSNLNTNWASKLATIRISS